MKTMRNRVFFAVAGLLLALSMSPAPVRSWQQPDPSVRDAVLNVVLPERDAVFYVVNARPNDTPRRMDIEMRFFVTDPREKVQVQMPVWSPGDYHEQNHGKFVFNLSAFDVTKANDKQELKVVHPDANTWQIEPGKAKQIVVTYSVPQTPPGFFSENVQVGEHQAFLNGPSAFLYVVGHKDRKSLLKLRLPQGWKAETALAPQEAPADGADSAATYSAPNYDTLADSPIVLGDAAGPTTREFKVNNVPHRIVFFGRKEDITDFDAYAPILQKIAKAEIDIMGGSPCDRYAFLFDVNGRGGGLEHLNCCRIALFARADARRFAPFAAHEYFHLWNIKRIRPAVLGPFDYVHPPKTRNLWFAEGVTEYYAHVATRRAGLSTEDEFLRHWQRAIGSMQRNPAHSRVTADESSLRVWESGDSQGFGGLSYYDKGELIGLCLDLKIRQVTNNAKSLDDVMRILMKRHNFPQPGYGEDEIREVVNEVAGQNLSELYDLLARSTKEMPFAECLGYAGLDENVRPLPAATPAQLALRKSWQEGKSSEQVQTPPRVRMVVANRGEMVIELSAAGAPKTVAHFLDLVQQKFYDGILFHRFEPGFVAQAGDPKSKDVDGAKIADIPSQEAARNFGLGAGGSGQTVPLEVKLPHDRGTIGLARAQNPDSGDSQFFLNLKDNHALDEGYCVFGKIVEGLDVMDKIRQGDRITSIRLITK